MAKLKTSAAEIPDFFGTTKTPDLAVARLARIPGADPAIYQQFVDAMGLRDTLQQGTKEYADGIRASQPEADRVAGQDIAELDSLYSPTGYQAALQGTRDRRTKALADLNNILFGDMRRGAWHWPRWWWWERRPVVHAGTDCRERGGQDPGDRRDRHGEPRAGRLGCADHRAAGRARKANGRVGSESATGALARRS
jgi:hypothetical protein